MPSANRLHAAHLCQHLFRRGRVVVIRAFHRSSRQNPRVVRPANDDSHALFRAQRQQLAQRFLLQQRVAASQQKGVEIAGAGKVGQHLPLVHAEADGLDDLLLAQLVERGIGLGHHWVEVPPLARRPIRLDAFCLVRVVDQHHVEAVRFEPRQTPLNRAQHRVACKVEIAGHRRRIYEEIDIVVAGLSLP